MDAAGQRFGFNKVRAVWNVEGRLRTAEWREQSQDEAGNACPAANALSPHSAFCIGVVRSRCRGSSDRLDAAASTFRSRYNGRHGAEVRGQRFLAENSRRPIQRILRTVWGLGSRK